MHIQAGTEHSVTYVHQDNYVYAPLKALDNITLYCDSATSCITLIVVGENQQGQEAVLTSHLSCPGRFAHFFALVKEHFKPGVKIYAAGANPPEPCVSPSGEWMSTARENAKLVMEWALALETTLLSLSFGRGDPSVYANNLDCFGIAIQDGAYRVSNQRHFFTNADRDPTGGVQKLFCMYGDKNLIRKQGTGFSKEETEALVRAARASEKNVEMAAPLSDREIIDMFSSTPGYEVPWYADTIRQAGVFVQNHT